MSEKNTEQDSDIEAQDNRTFEEKFRSIIEKVKPFLKRLWANRKKILFINTAVLVLTIIYLLFLTKPYFQSTVTILPEYGSKSNMLSQLSGLASLAGVKVGDSAPTELYQNIITSETVLYQVVYAMYKTNEFQDSVNLIKYFKVDVDENDPELKKRKEFLLLYESLLQNSITTNVDRMTKILNVTVTMPEAQLSADVANNLVKSLDLYIRTQRKSYATEQSFYIEKRTQQIKDSLGFAENKLKIFREQNRITTQSPNLLLEQGRLLRNIEILQTVYIELTKQLEISKIDQIKDAPVLNIKEFAKSPIKKAGPRRASTLLTFMLLSLLISSGYILFKDALLKYFRLLKN